MSATRLPLTLGIIALLLHALAAGCAADDQQAIADIFDKARTATAAQSSYRIDTSASHTMDTVGEIGAGQGEGAFVAPDRVRVRLTSDEVETIGLVIGSVKYTRSFPFAPERSPLSGIIMSAVTADSLSLGHSLATHFLETPDRRVERLPDDSIDGVATWHFRLPETTIDQIATLRDRIKSEIDPYRKRTLETTVEEWQEKGEPTISREVWIGQSDYIVRQQSIATINPLLDAAAEARGYPHGSRETTTLVLRFHDFGKPLTIEPPDLTGPPRTEPRSPSERSDCWFVSSEGDSLELLSLDPPAGTTLRPTERVLLTAQVRYDLVSHDSATIRFRVGGINTPSGIDQTRNIEIPRGSGVATLLTDIVVPFRSQIDVVLSMGPSPAVTLTLTKECFTNMAQTPFSTYPIAPTG